MGVRIGAGLSTLRDPRAGAIEAATTARDGLRGAGCDLVVVFAAGAHLDEPQVVLDVVHEVLGPEELIGCGAGGVLGQAREVEGGTAISVWAGHLGEEGRAQAFHATVEPVEGGTAGALAGFPDLGGAAGTILLADPHSFPTDPVLRFLSGAVPGSAVLGGIASGRTAAGTAALFLGDEVLTEGAVGVRLDGVEVLPCVSQGAAPLGPELTITACEGHVITELAGKPALTKLKEILDGLSREERELVSGGLLMGIVIDPGKPEYVQGDFLVRGLLGASPEDGTIAVGAAVRPGQVVRLHARDAASADRDLREALGIRMTALGGQTPAGALVFACNGRGRGMFTEPDHDAATVARELHGAPVAGFFAAGEIGPVGGENFLHGFTATVAVFVA